MGHQEDTPLEDATALAEIELYGDVVIAASASATPLSHQAIDEALGLTLP